MDDEKKEVEQEVYRRNPINWILIGLIAILAVLLIVEVIQMRNVEDNPLATEPTTIISETIPELTLEMFESESLLLKFEDVVISITNPELRAFYETLTNDLENFKKVKTSYIPTDSIFELNFEETKTSIYFYNETLSVALPNQLTIEYYCTVVHNGVVIGSYVVDEKYFDKLFEVIYASDELALHTENILKKQIPSLIENQEEISVKLDKQHKITEGDVLVTAFQTMTKNKEETSILFNVNEELFVVICYKNYQYHVFVADKEGKINVAKHYKAFSYNGNNLICYNELKQEETDVSQHFETMAEDFFVSENYIGLKVELE